MGICTKIMLTACLLLPAASAFAFNCGVSTTGVKFPGYDVFSSAPTNTTGTVTVSCTNPPNQPLPVTIAISSGSSGTFYPRQMRGAGSDRLSYYLFTDPSGKVIWGDGTGGSSLVTNVVTRQSPWTATIYGTLPPRQNLAAGSYSDTLLVTVSW